jgi:hypothetical protein
MVPDDKMFNFTSAANIRQVLEVTLTWWVKGWNIEDEEVMPWERKEGEKCKRGRVKEKTYGMEIRKN